MVTPGAKRELLEKTGDDSFALTVREQAKQNLANGRVREVLAQFFSVPLSHVRIISGHRSPKKIISIE